MDKIGRKNLIKEIRDYLMIAVGVTSYCIGWNIFLLPNNIATGAVPGIASVVYWGTGVPVQVTYLSINAVLLIIAFIILGWRFLTKTIYAVATLTLVTSYFQSYTNGFHLLADQPFMASIIGAIFCGSGIGLCFSYNGSTGGTDIVAAIVNKYRDISLGRVIMLMDIMIISSSYLVFHDWEKVIYGYVVLMVSSFCLDQVVLSRRRSVQFFIISDKYQEIASRIAVFPKRGATVIEAHGFYTGNQVKMLFIMAKKQESQIIFQIINDIDPHAFVTQSNVVGVYGNGFDKFKVRSHHPKAQQLTKEQTALLSQQE